MIELNDDKTPKRAIIPLSGANELREYHRGILGILREIDVHADSRRELINHIIIIYKLLDHLQIDLWFLLGEDKLKSDKP